MKKILGLLVLAPLTLHGAAHDETASRATAIAAKELAQARTAIIITITSGTRLTHPRPQRPAPSPFNGFEFIPTPSPCAQSSSDFAYTPTPSPHSSSSDETHTVHNQTASQPATETSKKLVPRALSLLSPLRHTVACLENRTQSHE